jgi:uncharacterized protein (DUF2062 family)
MPKRFIKRFIPEPHVVRQEKCFQFLGSRLHDPNLWHLNRHSVSGAVAVGLFIAFILVPFQSVLAALLAIYFRVNLPVSVILVWVSNPLTIAPIFLATVKLGEAILGLPHDAAAIHLNWEWVSTGLLHIWKPLIVGCLVLATFFSMAGYIATQYFWRRLVLRRYRNRHKRREAGKHSTVSGS